MNDRIDALPPAPTIDSLHGPRADLARAIPRRPRVTWWLGVALAAGFALLVLPSITAERWLASLGLATIVKGEPAPLTLRVPPFAGYDTASGHTGGGGVLIAKGERADRDTAAAASELAQAQPGGATPYLALLLLAGVFGGLFTHHVRRSNQGRLVRVQLVSLGLIVATAAVVKLVMLTTALSVLVVPVAVFAMVPTLVLDRIVGLATGTLAALVVAFLVPFDAGIAVLLLMQAGAAGLVIDERPKRRTRTVLIAGGTATALTAATYPLMLYLSAGRLPLGELADPLHSAWIAAAFGAAIATALALAFVPLYQRAVGEITHARLVALEDLSQPLLRQIAEKAPGTWQHSLTMANLAELAANAIGANGRLVRVGAYYHDLGKSLDPKYFIENLEPGETSPHDKLAPEASCDAIFKHVTSGIVAARRAGLHERIIDFMHMHHGNGVLEYFWAKCRAEGNPRGLSVEHFRYPGVPPQTRETAILSICDAVEAAARTLKKPEAAAIDILVQRIVYGKLHVGQLDESGLSMRDLRRLTESLRDTIRHANHGRIEYPWQKAREDASAPAADKAPRLDSLDRPARAETVHVSPTRAPTVPSPDASELALLATAPLAAEDAAPRDPLATPRQLRGPLPTDQDVTVPAPKLDADDVVVLVQPKPAPDDLIAQFAEDALAALDATARDTAKDPGRTGELPVADSSPVIEIVPGTDAAEPPEVVPAVRQRAATIPPIKPPTAPPPLGRRTPTIPPTPATTTTVPPPSAIRPPGINYLDDMITLRPQYEPKPALVVTPDDDGSVVIAGRDQRPAGSAAEGQRGSVEPAPPDDDFGGDTRQQSVEEIERLRRNHPTSEVDEADIEAAIELHPPARRGAIGVTRKNREE